MKEQPILSRKSYHHLLLLLNNKLNHSNKLIAVAKLNREILYKQIGKMMRKAREEKGISLRELARRIDCSPMFLSDMEKGNRGITENWVGAVIAALEESTGREATQ